MGHLNFKKPKSNFPWDSFEPGTDVTQIQCPGKQWTVEGVQTGTILIIGDLIGQWDLRGYNWLKRQLAVLAAKRETQREGYMEERKQFRQQSDSRGIQHQREVLADNTQ